MSQNNESFWLDDPSVLYENENYKIVIPTANMTKTEQLNTISRLCIYLLVIFLLFGNIGMMCIPIFGLVIVVIMYNLSQNNNNTPHDAISQKTLNTENNTDADIDTDTDADIEKNVSDNSESLSEIEPFDKNINIMGLIPKTNENDLNIPEFNCDQIEHKDNEIEFEIYSNQKKYNNFADDLGNNGIDERCIDSCGVMIKPSNVDEKEIQSIQLKNITTQDNTMIYDQDMYRSFEDAFNRKNSERQFFTTQNTVLYDQEAFARFCFGVEDTCKTNQTKCLRYQEKRFKYM